MSMSDREIRDLCRLACERTAQAIGSVTQLVDTDEERIGLAIAVLRSIARGAAEDIGQHAIDEGAEISFRESYTFIMLALARNVQAPRPDKTSENKDA